MGAARGRRQASLGLLLGLAVLLAMQLAQSPASAAQSVVLFSDDFESGSFATQGWTTTPEAAYRVWAPDLNTYVLIFHGGTLQKSGIDATGHDTITLDFNWGYQTQPGAAEGSFAVEWRPSGTTDWIRVFEESLPLDSVAGPLTNFESIALGPSAADSAIDIRFIGPAFAGAFPEGNYLKLDNVIVSGEPLPPPQPVIDIEKATNGEDADVPTGPMVPVGDTVTWTYVVTNTGNVTLEDVAVTDDQGVAVSCPQTTLAAGGSMTCTASGVAVAGQYANVGTAVGSNSGTTVTDSDPSHYFGETPPPVGTDGCTPGFWKNHTTTAVWGPSGYSPSQGLESVFDVPDALGFDNKTLVEALNFDGGGGVSGGAKILLRASVASLLNASHPLVAFELGESAVVVAVNAALASGDRDTMLALAGDLDKLNNRGCSIDAHGRPIA